MMPSLFISHGSPTTIIEQDSAARRFMMELGKKLPKPEAIVIASAHWETRKPVVNAPQVNDTIHDFYGFPEQLFQMRYPAPGAPALAQKISKLVGGTVDEKRGLDHGAWTPLHMIFPDAVIPVVQLSIQTMQGSLHHYEIGESLTELRKEGVMIIGSGSLTHNLGDIQFFRKKPDKWAVDFENWFVDQIKDNNHSELLQAEIRAPRFSHAHPREEHWIPLYVPMGAAKKKATVLHRGFEHKNLSMAAVRFD